MKKPSDINILYIENEPLFCDLFKTAISSCGYSLDVAHNGKDGLAIYAQKPYEIVAINYQLPDMNGLDIAQKLHADNPDLSLMLVAGKDNESIATNALTIGIDNYLIKDDERVFLELIPIMITNLHKIAGQRRERRQTQREYYRMLNAIEKSSEGFILFDAEDKFVYANQKYKELYPSEVPDLVPGNTFRDIVKRCAYEGIVTSAIGREEEWIDERVAKHQALTNVSEQQISSGKWVRINEFRTDEGGIFGVRTDITDLKQSRSELDFQKYALDEHAIVSICDVTGNITYSNDKFCDISGYSREELLGQNHRILKSGEHSEEFFADMWRTIASGEIWRGNIKNRKKDGSFYWVDATIVPSMNEQGRPFKYIAIRTDITERKKAEEVLQQKKEELERYVIELDASRSRMEKQAEAMAELAENEAALNEQLKYEIDVKNRFFSIISHDLKSPFTSLLGMTQLMSQMADRFNKDKLVQYANNVNEAGNRIFELLQNLLEWSRLQMEGTKLDREKISLEDLTRESIEILHAIALEKDISLTNKIKKTAAFADQDMVRTVIRNLIANSLKFTPSGGKIEVSSIKQDDAVQVTVSDTGVGMSPEQAEKIFSLDQKTTTTGTAGEKGTGLGLPLCKDMLEKNQGRIWVESTPGKGSQFHFTLPIEPNEK